MKILLDTHIYLWCLNDDKKLTKNARHLIIEADEVYVSTASIWEIAIKTQAGKLKIDLNALINEMTTCGFQQLPIIAEHALQLMTLPFHHRDPFDRMLIAQAISEPLRFLTADKSLTSYSELVMLA